MWNYDNSLNNYVEGIILTLYLDKCFIYCAKQKRFVRNLCRIQIMTGGSEIWDREDRNNDSRTPAVSQYLVPPRVGSSGSNYHPVGTTLPWWKTAFCNAYLFTTASNKIFWLE